MQNISLDCLHNVLDCLGWLAADLHNLAETAPIMQYKVRILTEKAVYDNVECRPATRFPRLKSLIYKARLPHGSVFPDTLTELRMPLEENMPPPRLPALQILDAEYGKNVRVTRKRYPALRELTCLKPAKLDLDMKLETLTIGADIINANAVPFSLNASNTMQRFLNVPSLYVVGVLESYALLSLPTRVVLTSNESMFRLFSDGTHITDKFEYFKSPGMKWSLKKQKLSIRSFFISSSVIGPRVKTLYYGYACTGVIVVPDHVSRVIFGHGKGQHFTLRYKKDAWYSPRTGVLGGLKIEVLYTSEQLYMDAPAHGCTIKCDTFAPQPSAARRMSLSINKQIINMNFPKLVSLTLNIHFAYSAIHHKILDGCPALERLSISGALNVESEVFQFPTGLKHLELYMLMCKPENLAELPRGLVTLIASISGPSTKPFILPRSLVYVRIGSSIMVECGGPRTMGYIGGRAMGGISGAVDTAAYFR